MALAVLPLVVLLLENSGGQAPQGFGVGEGPHDLGAATVEVRSGASYPRPWTYSSAPYALAGPASRCGASPALGPNTRPGRTPAPGRVG